MFSTAAVREPGEKHNGEASKATCGVKTLVNVVGNKMSEHGTFLRNTYSIHTNLFTVHNFRTGRMRRWHRNRPRRDSQTWNTLSDSRSS
jgi:hypothetical protein